MKFTDKSCQSTHWYTPPHIVDAVKRYFGGVIDLDPATTEDNPVGALIIRTSESPRDMDGLTTGWCGGYDSVYVNPPYGRETRKWIEKISQEAYRDTHIVALLPTTRWETEYFQECVLTHPMLSAVCFVRKRLKFIDGSGKPHAGNPHGSALWLFNGDYQRFAKAFGMLGVVIRPTVVMF